MKDKKVLESKIQVLVSGIIAELNNDLINKATIIEVQLNNDFSIATIYVSFLKNEKKSLEVLEKAVSYIRKELSKNLDIKKTPSIKFKLDDKLDSINKIESLIENK